MKRQRRTPFTFATLRPWRKVVASAVFAVVASNAVLASGEELATDGPLSLEAAVFGGDVSFDLRVRAEIADVDGLQTSSAYTSRLRLGYGSKTYNGWSFFTEFEDIRTPDDDRYNAAGSNANGRKTVIADPEVTELNQGYIRYQWDKAMTRITLGRQRIELDDERFVGNVGWRQNEQTFDAVTVVADPGEHIELFYSFVWDVNRVFGDLDTTPAPNRDYDSETHLVNLAFTETPLGRVTFFAYLMDFDGAGVAGPNTGLLSTETYGIRIAGESDLQEGVSLGYVFSYAKQIDGDDNTGNSENDYFFAEAKLVQEGATVGVGYEVLGSDKHGTVGFVTPLATGHQFNGWADVFLTTPGRGLQDAYVFATTQLAGDIHGRVVYHRFWTEEGGGALGDELDVELKKPISQRAAALAKYARFNGVGTTADQSKFWFQLEYRF